MQEAKDYIRERVLIVGDCWIWQRSVNQWGYGRVARASMRFGERQAHRISYRAFKGKIPASKHVLHTCDTPRCCNPKHLYLGTDQDNVNDMKNRGRLVVLRAAENGNAKLNWKSVREIRSSREKTAVLARKYGVSWRTVGFIRTNETWKETV